MKIEFFTRIFFEKLLIATLVVLLFSSCVTNNRIKLLKSNNKKYPKSYQIASVEPYKLRKGDKLKLFIESTVATSFDLIDQKFKQNGDQEFVLNADGIIDLPLIGKINALGLTINELEEQIEKRLKEYIEYVTVRVVFSEFIVTFLGEFKKSGETVFENKINMNILEVLSVGGLTDYTSPKRIKILRNKGDKMEVIIIDASKENIIENQYFSMHPNDLVYAEPLPGRNFRNNIQYITLLTTAVTFLILVSTNLRFFR